MSVGILLVSHVGIAKAMLETANRIWPQESPQIDYLEIDFDADTSGAAKAAEEKITALDSGQGVLVLTDIAGATPSNLLSEPDSSHFQLISGLNLPMVIKAYNYANKPLDELADLVIESGRNGITRID